MGIIWNAFYRRQCKFKQFLTPEAISYLQNWFVSTMRKATLYSLYYQKAEASSLKGYLPMADVYSNGDATIYCGSCESNKNLTCLNFASCSYIV